MATISLEDRVTTLEAKMAHILESTEQINKENSWLNRWLGVYKDDPYFDAAMESGAEYRRSQPNPADSPDAITF